MQNQYSKTKSIVEAGLLSAIVVIIMLLNVYVPVFSMVGAVILPIPITLLYIRHDFKVTISSVIVSMVMIGILYSPIKALVAAVMYGLTGTTLGYCIKYRIKSSLSMLYLAISSLIATVLSNLISITLIYKQSVYDFIKSSIDITKESNEIIQSFYSQIGVPSQYSDQMKMIMEFLTPEKVMLFLPGILVLGAFLAAFINYNVTRIILRKLKYEVNSLTPLERVYLDNRIGALLIIIFCIGIILNGRGFSLGIYMYISALIILLCAFALDGVALSVYYLKNKFKLNKGFIILIIVLAMMSQLIIVFLYLGISDMIFDFRKLDPNRMLRRKSK